MPTLTEERLPTVVSGTGGQAIRIVCVGAGPAAAMLLERLLASHREEFADLPLDVTLVDAFEPGGGRIWRREQSPLLKLNSMLADVAFFPDASSVIEGPVAPGPSLAEWVELVRDGKLALPAWSDRVLVDEIASIGPSDFPTRRLNSAYLNWAYGEVLRRAAPSTQVRWRQARVTAVVPGGGSTRGLNPHTVQLSTGEQLTAEIVVYAVGHNGAAPTPESQQLDDFAATHGLRYVAPAFTADIDLSWVEAGSEVIVRGMGLAAVDLVVLLTEGRGGRFTRQEGGSLRYQPSGREPRLVLGSRRGVPYRSKVTSQVAGEPVTLEYLGPEFHERVGHRSDLDFETEVWPLICAELLVGYYRELFTAHPDQVIGSWPEFSAQLRAVIDEWGAESVQLQELVCVRVPHPDDRFAPASFFAPLAHSEDVGQAAGAVASEPPGLGGDESGSSAEVVHDRVLRHIRQDLRQRTRQRHSANQALFLTTLYAYMSIAEVPAGCWNQESRASSLPRRWHTTFSYLASGPPAHRLEELLALAEAGVIRFLGGALRLELDEQRGRFVASGSAELSGSTSESSARAEVLIDAWLPTSQIARSDNPLLRQLVESGVVDEGNGQLLVADSGAVVGAENQFAIGPFTSAPGAGAFTRPGINALPFRVHDRAARAILERAQAIADAAHFVEPFGGGLR